jgi:hypothetical protein
MLSAAAALLAVVGGAAPLKLATVGFSQVGLSEAQGSFYAEHLATKLAEDPNVRVVTPKDMAAVLGVEKQRQLLGCSDQSSSCMAELAGALGADGLVMGQLAKVGKSFQVNVKIIAGDGSRTLYVHSSKLLGSEEDVIEELNQVAPQAIARIRAELFGGATPGSAPAEATSVSASSGGSSKWPRLVPSILGVLMVAGSAAAFGFAADFHGKLTDQTAWPTLEPMTAMGYKTNGENTLGVGIGLAIGGVACLVGGVLWYFLGGS